jgi:predicted RNA-binding Zn-ribbon protein involved in translation (DUF1610 family)
MSENTPHRLECPRCGNAQGVLVWESINVTIDPELKQNLFDAEINVFKCESCGNQAMINVPLLYHDMTNQFCVQYYPPELLDDPQFPQGFNPDGSMTMPGLPMALLKSGEYLTRPHIVFDLNEMIRYVIFRDLINPSTS